MSIILGYQGRVLYVLLYRRFDVYGMKLFILAMNDANKLKCNAFVHLPSINKIFKSSD